MDAHEPPEPQELQIDLPSELESGIYANFAIVHHTNHEVTIDFCLLGSRPPEGDEAARARVVARIHMAPTFVMPLLQAISTNIAQRDDALRQQQEGHEP